MPTETTEPEGGPAAALGQRLFAAAAAGDLEALRAALAAGADPGWADDAAGGTSALMAAAEGGHRDAVLELLQAGAPWTQLDHDGFCAGEYAARHAGVAELLMEWGVRAQLLAEQQEEEEEAAAGAEAQQQRHGQQQVLGYLQQRLTYTPDGDRLLDADGEAVMMGWEAPLMARHAAVVCGGAAAAGAAAAAAERGAEGAGGGAGGGGCTRQGGGAGRVLNVGFGLGIVDREIQGHSPSLHVICEAHPDVHARMLARGWGDRPNVRIVFGRWQDKLAELEALGPFDGIFWDTYGEYREEARDWHRDALPRLLRRRSPCPSPAGGDNNRASDDDASSSHGGGGVYSFFNGFASDNVFFHCVVGRLIQVELEALGFRTRYERLQVAELGDDVWQGVANKYWRFKTYFLPVVTWAPPPQQQHQEQQEQRQQQEAAAAGGGA